MTKVRIVFFTITLIVVGALGLFAAYYAKGYKFDIDTLKFQPNGILVLKSEPDGASVYINGELKSATDANISIAPGIYDIEVKKDGYFNWYKRLTIEKEVVTQANISLFKTVPSLSPVTYIGAVNPVMSKDGSKIVYSVLPRKGIDDDKTGLWTLDAYSLPLGFSTSPTRITDADMTDASYIFSPEGDQILLTISKGIFLLESKSFTSQNNMINIAAQEDETLVDWKSKEEVTNQSLIKNLPSELADILSRKTSSFVFSPNDNMILYTASTSAILPDNLIKQLPGASTQSQERELKAGRTYVYDIKEDRNFLITDKPVTINNSDNSQTAALRWMSSSLHLLLADAGEISIMDYDGTNRQVVYSGSYIAPYAFPFSNTTKLLVLTNLGAASASANLYTLTVK